MISCYSVKSNARVDLSLFFVVPKVLWTQYTTNENDMLEHLLGKSFDLGKLNQKLLLVHSNSSE